MPKTSYFMLLGISCEYCTLIISIYMREETIYGDRGMCGTGGGLGMSQETG